MGYILGVDCGTTLTTALLLNEDMRVVSVGQSPTEQLYPQSSHVEQLPRKILGSFLRAAALAIDNANIKPCEVEAIGIDHQGETCLIWNKVTGEPIYNAISWQDRRTAEEVNSIKEKYGEYIFNTTGLIADSYYSASKLAWILDNVPGARDAAARGELCAGTLNTYFIYMLCGEFVSDACTGGRYMLMDLKKTEWDKKMLDIFDIPEDILPPLYDCARVFGYTRPESFFGVSVPIMGSITDSNAALIGSGLTTPGALKASYGTGCFMSLYTGKTPIFSDMTLSSTCCRRLNGVPEYTMCGAVYSAGSAIEWMRRVGLIDKPADSGYMARDCENTGVYFVPAFSGIGSPYWDQDAKAQFVGIDFRCGREQLVRAVLESSAYRVTDCIDCMNRFTHVNEIVADGGMTKDVYLMQFQADITGVPVSILSEKENSAFGAAALAALSCGKLGSIGEIAELNRRSKTFEPKMSADERESLLDGWQKAKAKCLA